MTRKWRVLSIFAVTLATHSNVMDGRSMGDDGKMSATPLHRTSKQRVTASRKKLWVCRCGVTVHFYFFLTEYFLIFILSQVFAPHRKTESGSGLPISGARQYGTVGLVMANCVAMLGRTLFAVHFAAHYFAAPTHEGAAAAEQNGLPVRRRRRRRLVQRMLPANVVLVAFGVAYLGTRASRDRMAQHIQEHGVEIGSRYWWRLSGEHVTVGVTIVVGILTVAYTAERDWRHQIRTLWHGKSEEAKNENIITQCPPHSGRPPTTILLVS